MHSWKARDEALIEFNARISERVDSGKPPDGLPAAYHSHYENLTVALQESLSNPNSVVSQKLQETEEGYSLYLNKIAPFNEMELQDSFLTRARDGIHLVMKADTRLSEQGANGVCYEGYQLDSPEVAPMVVKFTLGKMLDDRRYDNEPNKMEIREAERVDNLLKEARKPGLLTRASSSFNLRSHPSKRFKKRFKEEEMTVVANISSRAQCSLAHKLQAENLDMAERKRVLGRTLANLKSWQDNGRAHNDLHVGNILYLPNGDTVFNDFDSATEGPKERPTQLHPTLFRPELRHSEKKGTLGHLTRTHYHITNQKDDVSLHSAFSNDMWAVSAFMLELFTDVAVTQTIKPKMPDIVVRPKINPQDLEGAANAYDPISQDELSRWRELDGDFLGSSKPEKKGAISAAGISFGNFRAVKGTKAENGEYFLKVKDFESYADLMAHLEEWHGNDPDKKEVVDAIRTLTSPPDKRPKTVTELLEQHPWLEHLTPEPVQPIFPKPVAVAAAAAGVGAVGGAMIAVGTELGVAAGDFVATAAVAGGLGSGAANMVGDLAAAGGGVVVGSTLALASVTMAYRAAKKLGKMIKKDKPQRAQPERSSRRSGSKV